LLQTNSDRSGKPCSSKLPARARPPLVRLANGPVNALSIANGFLARPAAAIKEAEADPEVAAIVVAGEGCIFCGGADIKDFDGDPTQIDRLRDLVAQKPAQSR
jgi:enoyl-CoA hydratase/carnithine racemase